MAPTFEERVQRLLRPGLGGPRLDDSAVERAENALGVSLPRDLLAVLRHQNGGYVRDEFASCPTSRPTSWASDHVAVNEIAGIDSREVLSLLDTPQLNDEWRQPRELILISGDGHWWIALDYRDCGPTGEPPVIFYENESEGAPDELRLAASFRTFIEMLRPEPDDDRALEPLDITEAWIDPEFAREHDLKLPRTDGQP